MDKTLTNLDISTHHRDKEYWFMRGDFTGAFAYWVVKQSPYFLPDIYEPLKAFGKYVSKRIKEGIPEKFTYDELKEFINEDVLESIPEVEILNHSKKPTGEYVFVTRDTKPHPDYDFIDLGALSRNIFYMVLREYITN